MSSKKAELSRNACLHRLSFMRVAARFLINIMKLKYRSISEIVEQQASVKVMRQGDQKQTLKIEKG